MDHLRGEMLGLGVGATTTIFSVINTLFLRPPAHVQQPERLVAIYTSDFSGPVFGASSHPDYLDFAEGAPGLVAIAASSPRPFSVAAGRRRFRALGEMVSRNYFAVLGVPLALGAGSDPLTYAAVALVLLGAAAVACAIPARRASRIDPVAPRSE